MIYNIWKLIHILAAIIFIGNITVNIFWKSLADKSNDRLKISETFRNIIKADRIFTMPSVFVLFVFGLGAAMQGDLSLVETTWILWGIIMLIVSSLSFMLKLVPIQKQIYILSSNQEKFSQNEFLILSKSWNKWAIVAVLPLYIAVALMVLKP